jgi:hypothetical protein
LLAHAAAFGKLPVWQSTSLPRRREAGRRHGRDKDGARTLPAANERKHEMAKALTKTSFGAPSADVLTAIDASDKCAGLQAAGYTFTAKLAELERQFEAKASELRTEYLEEVAAIQAA